MLTRIRTVCFQARAYICRGAGHQDRPESENPIAHRLGAAGSGYQDFRTPAGIRNSSGEPPVRFWALTLRKRTFVHQASSDRIALSIGLLPSNALIPKAAT